MYAYKPTGDTWKMMIWDIDFAFLGLPPTSDPFQGIGRSNGIDLAEPAYARRYWQILQDLATGPLSGTKLFPILDAKYRAITANALSIENPSAIKSYISQRQSYLLSLIASNVPAAFSLKLNNGADFSTNRNWIALTGTAPIGVRSIAINGAAFPVTWTSVSNWMARLALAPGTNLLAVQGLDASGNPLSGAGATMSVNYTGAVELPQDKLLFNEIQCQPAVPGTGFVELYNLSGTTAFDLSGWELWGVDFTFPPGTAIAPNGYLVVAEDRPAFGAAYGLTLAVAGEFAGTLQGGPRTLSLVKPGPTPAEDLVAAQVRYDVRPPWPAAAAGTGSSLQLVDARQDNWRVGNWAAVPATGTTQARATPGAANSLRSTLAPFPPVWINEVQAQNLSGITNSAGQRAPWLELFNPTTNAASLTGLYLANNYSNLTQWAFPAGATLGPQQFMVIFADGQSGLSASNQLHTSFTLAGGAGSLALSRLGANQQPQVLDYLDYTNLAPDHSYGSWPDGQSFVRQEFLLATPGATNSVAPPPLHVFINEWMAANQSTLPDPADGHFNAWFELYNAGDASAGLSGYYMGQSLTNWTRFLVPAGYGIPPRGFLLVWADNEPSQNSPARPDLHVNFKLSRTGDAIGLFAPDGSIVDLVGFGPQTADVSQGRFPDGAAEIVTLSRATPGAANFLLRPNTPPILQAIPDCTVIEGQSLAFTVTATDTDAPPQHLTFSLDPGAPAGAAIDPDTGLFSWQPAPAQAPGPSLITVRVTDDGVPPLSAVASFTVRVFPRPRVTAVVPNPAGAGSGCAMTFVTVPGKTYRVEFKNSLEDALWQALGSDTLASGESLTVIDPATLGPQRFYRVVVQ